MKKMTVTVLFLLMGVHNLVAQEECTIGVASGMVTQDGRPLLWKNRDIPHKYRNNDIRYISGSKYSFQSLMTVGYEQYAWAGTNTQGLCIVNAASNDLSGTKTDADGNGEFLKKALGMCASVNDFKKLLERTNWPGRTTYCNYGVIDATGAAAIFETRNYSFTMFDANDPEVAPEGFLIRANFALTGKGEHGKHRFHRAGQLWARGIETGVLGPKYVLQNVARDLMGADGNVLDLSKAQTDCDNGRQCVDTGNCINRSSTSAAVVFSGVKKGEHACWTTMWSVLGQPVFSMATPSWAFTGEIPSSLGGEMGSPICLNAMKIYDAFHIAVNRNGKQKYLLIPQGVASLSVEIIDAENKIFNRVQRFLEEQRVADNSKCNVDLVKKFQEDVGRRVLREMEGFTARTLGSAPLKVGVYSDGGASPVCVVETIAALQIDQGIYPVSVKAVDIMTGILDEIDVLIFPGGSGSKEANSMGEAGREKIREFVLVNGKGVVGICAGGYLLSSTPVYTWSLKLTSADVMDRAHYNRGRGLIQLELSADAEEFFPELIVYPKIFLQYYDGPVLVPSQDSPLPAYRELGTYVTDIHLSGNSSAGVTPGKTALLLNIAGKGRVFSIIGHPESTPGMRWMVPRMARIVGNRKLVSYDSSIVRPFRDTQERLFDKNAASHEKKMFWKLVGDSVDDKLEALDELVIMRSRPALRWAIGMLRDKDPTVRKKAAQVLGEAEYTPAINDLRVAFKMEPDTDCREALEDNLNRLIKIIKP